MIKKESLFRGLDTRTNKLYRTDGTASDCRNVYLDSNGRLVKIEDRESLNIPRANEGETGEFLDQLPYEAIIIDIMPYEDYLVIATKIPYGSPIVTHHVNKFYKFFLDSETVEFIPFQMETFNDPNLGQIINKVGSDADGKFTYTNQEKILYFMGQYSDSTRADTFPVSTLDAQVNNLGAKFYFNGKVIGFAGVQSSIVDSVRDEGTKTDFDEQYVRILPIKIDYKQNHIYGNYSTHLSTSSGEIALGTSTPEILKDNAYDYMAFCKAIGNNELSSNGTLNVDIYNRSSEYRSIAKGQYIYSVTLDRLNTPFGVPTKAQFFYTIYRADVTEVDYSAGTIEVDNFHKYNSDSGLFESSPNFKVEGGQFLSNVLCAFYTSDNFTFGFKFAGYSTLGYDPAGHTYDFVGRTPASYTDGFIIEENGLLLYTSTDFEDIYDEDSVKSPPPRGRQLIDYLGAIVIVDEDRLYFSDFSVGGKVENFSPLDNFPVGSSKRGEIRGIFANQTFIAVFREEETYYITGNIFLSNYRIQSYKSTRIGCTSPTSIIEFAGGGAFLSKRGFYLCQQGGAMSELGDTIENIFSDNFLGLDLDLSQCTSFVDYQKEYIHFHVASTSKEGGYLFSYSYYFNEWFLSDYIDASGGIDTINGKVYSSDGEELYVNSLGSAKEAEAKYVSNFHTLGAASLLKKFHQILLHTVDTDESFSITFKTFRDWNKEEPDTEEVKAGEPNTVDMTQRLNPRRSKSLAFEILSESGNPLMLDGYEYEVTADVQRFKNDDN